MASLHFWIITTATLFTLNLKTYIRVINNWLVATAFIIDLNDLKNKKNNFKRKLGIKVHKILIARKYTHKQDE